MTYDDFMIDCMSSGISVTKVSLDCGFSKNYIAMNADRGNSIPDGLLEILQDAVLFELQKQETVATLRARTRDLFETKKSRRKEEAMRRRKERRKAAQSAGSSIETNRLIKIANYANRIISEASQFEDSHKYEYHLLDDDSCLEKYMEGANENV